MRAVPYTEAPNCHKKQALGVLLFLRESGSTVLQIITSKLKLCRICACTKAS
jgi:hypothetical protein